MIDPNGLCGEEKDEACSDSDVPDGGGGGGGGGGSPDPTSGGAIDDSGASCLGGSSTCGVPEPPLVDNSLLTAGGFNSNGSYLTNSPLPDPSSLTTPETSNWQDQQLQLLAPGILQGAGSIGDTSTYGFWLGGSILGGAAGSAAALYEAGTEAGVAAYEFGVSAYTDVGANLITWQTGVMVMQEGGDIIGTDAGFAEAFDIISNGLNPFTVTGTGNGAIMGAMINLLINPPAYNPPWQGIPYPSPSGGHR